MRLIITNNIGKWTANYIKEAINRNLLDIFTLGLPTGGTAVDLYKNLISLHRQNFVSFENVVTFNMDEYIGLPQNHTQSYFTFMQENLFKHINIKPENINIPNGNAMDIKKECGDYEEKIKKSGGIDLFIGGVGENGHIAFNEPYSSLASHTRDKELSKNTISANARFFDENISLVPKSAITVGIKTLLESKEIIIMISGAKKAFALQHCLEGGVSHLWPISVLQFHEKAIIVCDEEATAELKVKTYKYFKELEDEYSYVDKL